LGDIWQRKQRVTEALAAYTDALKLAPGDPDRYLALGRALNRQGLYSEAVTVYERALRIDSERVDVHVELGDALCAQNAVGNVLRACDHYWRAMQIDPYDPQAHRGLARVHADRGERKDALEILLRGEQYAPRCVDLYVDEAEVQLRPNGDPSSAIDPLVVALHINPHDVRACRVYVETLRRLPFQRGNLVGALCSLGAALEMPGSNNNLAEALKAYQEAVSIKPDCLRALLRLGDLALRFGEPQKAIEYFEAALAIDPEHPIAHINLGWALRITGDFTRGWKESAWNFLAGDKRRFEQPLWDGSPLCGRTLLLWAESALGDTIQDLRYLPFVKVAAAAGPGEGPDARIVVECDRRLVSLVDGLTVVGAAVGVIQIVANDAPLPAFDVHLPLRQLPEVLGIDLSVIPNRVPYLKVKPHLEAAWRETLALGRSHSSEPGQGRGAHDGRDEPHERNRDITVGIVWAGDESRADAHSTSASLMAFEPLAHIESVRFISLQRGPSAAELVAPPTGLRVERTLTEFCSAADTAAVMNNLDLIITVDGMTAHLAGALGKPVWVLAAFSPAWWLRHCDGDRSLWYPTIRVFRQEMAGNWTA
jgi:tetratricopeptide (TPR) repeat protein